MRIDLNADCGESFGAWRMGRDAELLEVVTSANLACGFHAGDPRTMLETIDLARAKGVAVGAHPGFPDLVGFGRREIQATPEEVYADVLYQIGALRAMLRVAGLPMQHVKAHGALYNRATRDPETARAIARAVHDFSGTLVMLVLPNTPLETEARALGVPVALEGFPERGYAADGRLAPRGTSGATIHDPAQAAQRALEMVRGSVTAVDGTVIPVRVDTLCIHGDNPAAPEIARAVRGALEAEGIEVKSLSSD